ncbi:MAG: HD domain-containing phosphohydrolase [Phycisphaerales bacterium]
MTEATVPPTQNALIDAVKDQLDVLIRVCNRLNDPQPADYILDDLLTETRQLVNAEAGTVLLRQDGGLRFVCCHNDRREELCIKPEYSAATAGIMRRTILPLNARSLAGFVATQGEPLRIDDAYGIEHGAPYTFDDSVDQSTGYRTRSMLVIPLSASGTDPIGVMQLINKRDPASSDIMPFGEWDEHIATALSSMATLLVKNAQLHESLQKVHLDTIFRLAQAAEFRDDDTGAHIQRVSMYCELTARAMGMEHEFCQRILFASPMHDVGKLGIADAVLKKPGKLTDDERAHMCEHTVMGAKILQGSTDRLIQMAERIAMTHHEKWDGTGYPNKLKGEEIPIEGRITAVADVFDALTSARVYKPPFPIEKSFSIIQEDSGTHFDPRVVEAFMSMRSSVSDIYDAYRD